MGVRLSGFRSCSLDVATRAGFLSQGTFPWFQGSLWEHDRAPALWEVSGRLLFCLDGVAMCPRSFLSGMGR